MDFFEYIQSWRYKIMDEWQNEDVLNFIFHATSINCHDFDHKVNVEKFRCISGYIFQTLSLEHCRLLSGSDYMGEIIFNAKEAHLNSRHSMSCEGISAEFRETTAVPLNSSAVLSGSTDLRIDDFAIDSEFGWGNENISISDQRVDLRDDHLSKSLRKSKDKVKRSKLLWEFILELLTDSKTCPELIRWEDFEAGTFRFVQSHKVAQLWGNRNHNGNMNYEKFSRALRYHYKNKALLPVPGKRLVYKFGPEARGWNRVKAIF